MKSLAFEVKRLRPSVTQGEASVYCNGVKLVQFGDKIEMDGKGNFYHVYTRAELDNAIKEATA